MKIAIVGSGAVGCYYGALMAKSGQDVTFIARGENLTSLKTHGIRVKSHFGDFVLPQVNATDDPMSVGYVDLILLCVKTYATEQAAKSMLPLIGPDTVVIPLQNGNMTEQLGELVGIQHILGGLTYIFVSREAAGVINQTSNFHRIIFGELNGEKSARAKAIHNVLEQCGLTAILSDNITQELWSKLMFISPMGAVSSIVRLPVGEYRNIPETRALLVNAMQEIESVAKAKGVKFDANIIAQKMELVDNLNPQSMTSMQRDVMAGTTSEVEELVQSINVMGNQNGIPTPTYQFMYSVLKPVEVRARQPK
jgi:2-dehydropantoate 2-reductase